MNSYNVHGFTKPSTRLLLANKIDIIQTISLHHTILKTLGELSQFRDGLKTLGVGKAMVHHGDIYRNILSLGIQKERRLVSISALSLYNTFKINYRSLFAS